MSQTLYYAQHREDQWIAENLPLPEKGFYVDIGCGHPFTTSNTAFLRDRKWEGLAIDGNRQWENEWEDIPAFHVAVIASQPRVSFLEDEWWSRITPGEIKNRDAETIEEVLTRFDVGKIDFLSVDTEGTEFEILQSFDFKKHDPPIVIVEYNTVNRPLIGVPISPIPRLMRDRGYNLVKVFAAVNMIFTR